MSVVENSYLRNLCSLSGTRFSFDDDDLVFVNGFFQLVQELVNGKLLSLLQKVVISLGKGNTRQGIGLRLEDEVRCLRESTICHLIQRKNERVVVRLLSGCSGFQERLLSLQKDPTN